jgi:hypothetical protein
MYIFFMYRGCDDSEKYPLVRCERNRLWIGIESKFSVWLDGNSPSPPPPRPCERLHAVVRPLRVHTYVSKITRDGGWM